MDVRAIRDQIDRKTTENSNNNENKEENEDSINNINLNEKNKENNNDNNNENTNNEKVSSLSIMQEKAWLMHWSLFVFFNKENALNELIALFQGYITTIQTLCPHLLRYVTAAILLSENTDNLSKLKYLSDACRWIEDVWLFFYFFFLINRWQANKIATIHNTYTHT